MTILDSGFFQIPHWLPSGSGLAILLFRKVQGEFLRAPLPSPTCSLLPRAMAGLAPASRLACRSHTTATALRASATVPTTNGLTACRMRSAYPLRSSRTSGPYATAAIRSRLRLPGTTRLALRASMAGSGCQYSHIDQMKDHRGASKIPVAKKQYVFKCLIDGMNCKLLNIK